MRYKLFSCHPHDRPTIFSVLVRLIVRLTYGSNVHFIIAESHLIGVEMLPLFSTATLQFATRTHDTRHSSSRLAAELLVSLSDCLISEEYCCCPRSHCSLLARSLLLLIRPRPSLPLQGQQRSSSCRCRCVIRCFRRLRCCLRWCQSRRCPCCCCCCCCGAIVPGLLTSLGRRPLHCHCCRRHQPCCRQYRQPDPLHHRPCFACRLLVSQWRRLLLRAALRGVR